MHRCFTIVHMAPRTAIADEQLRTKIRQLVNRHGLTNAAERFGCDQRTLLRAVGGVQIMRQTLTALKVAATMVEAGATRAGLAIDDLTVESGVEAAAVDAVAADLANGSGSAK